MELKGFNQAKNTYFSDKTGSTVIDLDISNYFSNQPKTQYVSVCIIWD